MCYYSVRERRRDKRGELEKEKLSSAFKRKEPLQSRTPQAYEGAKTIAERIVQFNSI